MTNMSREKILRDSLEMARHNLLCYSNNFLCTVPKDGKENQYKETVAEVKMLETWLKEFHSTRTDSTREFIGHINGIVCGKTYDGKPHITFIEFEVDTGIGCYAYGDVRTFHVGQEVQDWIISGKYDSEKDRRKSECKMSKPKPAGNFNVGVMARLYDKNEKYIGSCFYAPVPVARAIKANPEIAIIKAKYPMFAEEVTKANDYQSWMTSV